ncbi:hypothetical protein AB0I53_30265 [Saccharopolyspora sp. NPDC050389]|uniref:hypothetical protein n=1 Tax=Saccharopolyspora sp. NPDC050389 TaxID=3155516 RepID=UPI0033DFE8A2
MDQTQFAAGHASSQDSAVLPARMRFSICGRYAAQAAELRERSGDLVEARRAGGLDEHYVERPDRLPGSWGDREWF